MIKYFAAGLALKTFSINQTTKKLYRLLGNTLGARRRAANADLASYIKRGDLFIELCRKYNVVNDGDRVLEIGTGWMHWYALYLRLYFDLHITTLDVWDCRQFDALQATFGRLRKEFEARNEDAKAMRNLEIILGAANFDDLYSKLNMDYVIEPTGAIARFADKSFDLVFSFHVLEHVPIGNVCDLARQMFRVTKDGKNTVHQIGIDDHLAHYDASASPKQYVEFSDRTWKMLFENEVQYFNRLQTSDWIRFYTGAGFFIEEQIEDKKDISRLKIAPKFQGYPQSDLGCTTLTLVLRKS